MLDDDIYYSPEQIKRKLRFKSVDTVRKLCRSKRLRAIQINGRWRISRKSFIAFMEGC